MSFRQSPTDPAFVQDPYPAYERIRALGRAPVWEDYGFPVIPAHADVSAIFRDRRFGREITHVATREELGWPPIPDRLAPFYAFESHSLLEREPPAHTRLRRLASRAFTSRAIAALAPRIESLANALIDGFGPEPDLIADYATPIPMTVIAELLGAPLDASAQMLSWSHDMVAMYEARRDREAEDRAVAATLAFSAFMRDLIAARRAAPGDALIDALIAAEDAGDRLTEPELVATCILLLNAGHEATVHGIGNAAKLALEGRLPAAAFADPRADAAVEEALRLDPPLHLFTRYALQDAEAAGRRFRKGETVGLLLAAANRDPVAFPDPAQADLSRPDAARHQAFGGGIHFCVGAPLARLEMKIALATLFRRLPALRLAAPPRYSDRYHFHGLAALRVTA